MPETELQEEIAKLKGERKSVHERLHNPKGESLADNLFAYGFAFGLIALLGGLAHAFWHGVGPESGVLIVIGGVANLPLAPER